MKRSFFLPLLILALTVQAQTNDSPGKKGRPGITINADSITVKLQRMQDSVNKTLRSVDEQDIERNVSSLLRLQKDINKREAKQKRDAIIRIAIGVALLIVLIIGLRRKRRKKP